MRHCFIANSTVSQSYYGRLTVFAAKYLNAHCILFLCSIALTKKTHGESVFALDRTSLEFWKYIIIYAGYVLESYITYEYIQTVFRRKRSGRFTFPAFVIGFNLLFAINLFNNIIVNLISHAIVISVLIILCYEFSVGAVVFHTTTLNVMLMISELISVAALNIIYGENYLNTQSINIYLFASIISKLMFLLTCKFMSRFAQKENPHSRKSYLLFLLPISSALNIMLIVYLTSKMDYGEKVNWFTAGSCVLLLFANIMVFILYENSIKTEQALSVLRLSEQKNKLDFEYNMLLEQRLSRSRMLVHDVKHHFGMLYSMARESGDTASMEYIREYMNQDIFVTSALRTGNKIADVIINNNHRVCQAEGIKLELVHNNVDFSFVNDIDLCCIFSNLSDNAVESAKKSKNKTVDIVMYESENKSFKFIEISNSCDQKPVFKDFGMVSTKKDDDGKLHGVGIYSVKRAVEKYDGDLKWNYDENKREFTVVVMLQMPREKH